MGSVGGHLPPLAISNSVLWNLSSTPTPSPDVNYEELARCTDDFNGAQCKAVCVEAVSAGVREWVTLSLLAPFPEQDGAFDWWRPLGGRGSEGCGLSEPGQGCEKAPSEPMCPGCRA